MKITRLEKILLALMLAGCLTVAGAASAEEQTYTIYTETKKDSSDNELYTVTVTVTADDSKTTTYTYTDVNGETHTYYTNPTVSSPTVTVTSADKSNLLDLSSLNLSYDSPNTSTGTASQKYYAWTEDGFVETDKDGNYQIRDKGGNITKSGTTAVNVTVSYVESEIGKDGIYNINSESTYNGQDIPADFVGLCSEGRAAYNNYGGAINNLAISYKTSLGTITGNFIGNYYSDSQDGYGGAIANCTSTDDRAIIEAINGNFVGNYVTTTESNQSYGGAIYNSVSGAAEYGATATIGKIEGDFIGNYATSENAAYGGAIYNSDSTAIHSDHTAMIEEIEGNFIGNYATSQYAAYGGAIYNSVSTANSGNTATIGKIEGNFIGNHADSAAISGHVYGGAIYNDSGTIGDIEGDFIGNYAKSGYVAYGGAIYNSGTIGTENDDGTVTGIFIGNYAESDGEESAAVGAIYNAGTFCDIYADFIGNYAKAGGAAEGGAINNTMVSSTDDEDNTTYSAATISSITGDFIGNHADSTVSHAYGGAIYNDNGTIGNIKGDFIGNYAKTAAGYSGGSSGASYSAYGGAIDNTGGKIGTIEGDFIGNYANSNANYASGGAIYNAVSSSGSGGTIESIAGNFVGNYATSSANDSYGGAIYNEGLIGINADGGTTGAISNSTFVENEASNGGAIYNNYSVTTADDGSITSYDGAGTITEIKQSYFEGNKATEGSGGAIYNASIYDAATDKVYAGTIGTITNTSFVNNSAGEKGGAIYTTSDLTIAADGASVVFQGNTSGDGGDAIYMAADGKGEATTVTFSLSNGGSVALYDSVSGDEGYGVNISGDGTFYLCNDLENAALAVGSEITPLSDTDSGTLLLSTVNDEIHTYKVKSFTLADDFNMVADVDLAKEEMDRFETSDHENGGTYYGTGKGYTLTVSGMNLLSDATSDRVAIYFAEPGLMKNVASGISGLPDSYLTAYTPIYKYNVYYMYNESGTIPYGDDTYYAFESDLIDEFEDGGYFVFAKNGENPSSGGGDEGGGTEGGSTEGGGTEGGGDGSGGNPSSDDDPSHSGNSGSGGSGSHDRLENYNPAVLAPEVAMAGVYRAMNMMFEYNFEHSDYYMKLPEEVRLAKKDEKQAEPVESDPTKPEYYNRHELTETAGWFRAFASNESVEYQQGFESRDKYYGGMFGFDTKMNIHDNGWASVFTGYAGTLGIRQEYSGGHIKQHGGFLGATASFYKKNFYTAWTVAAGTMKAHEHTMYGKDKERIDNYGVAARLGYNFEFGDGKFSLLPTFTASYSYIHPEDFTSAADVHFTGSGLRAVQLNPNLKFIWNRDDGLQPYLTVGEVWTVAESSHVTATWAGQSHKLVSLDLRPYTEYGIGVQKRWANQADMYLQVLGHSHSRDGILVNAGIRMNF